MNEPCTPQPATAGTSPAPSIDLVAGDPLAPITVWRNARSDQDTSHSVPARLAYRMVAALSHLGEEVIDLTEGHALTEIAVADGRAPVGRVVRCGDAYDRHRRANHYGPVPVERAVTLRAVFEYSLAVACPSFFPHASVRKARTAGVPTFRHGAGSRLPSTANRTARAENLAGAGVGWAHHRFTWPPPERLGWGLLSDER